MPRDFGGFKLKIALTENIFDIFIFELFQTFLAQ